MNTEFPKVKHKVIDSHLHFYDWISEDGEYFFHCFEDYRNEMGLAGINHVTTSFAKIKTGGSFEPPLFFVQFANLRFNVFI